MFRQLLSVAFVPEIWKNAVIIPVHKKGPTNLIKLQSVLCKLLEHIVADKKSSHFVHNNILCSEQHGSVRGRSTCTNLLESLNNWTHNIEEGHPIVIYINFSKAFDVQHDKFFVKLHAFDIIGTLLDWIKQLFCNRMFQTDVNDFLWAVCSLLCGVIQGSVLGPLLFLIYINDFVELLASFNITIELFADDVKLYVKVLSPTDEAELQNAISALV